MFFVLKPIFSSSTLALGALILKRRRLLPLLLLFEVKGVNGLESAKEERMKYNYGEVSRSELSAQSRIYPVAVVALFLVLTLYKER